MINKLKIAYHMFTESVIIAPFTGDVCPWFNRRCI